MKVLLCCLSKVLCAVFQKNETVQISVFFELYGFSFD
jgi:hypothetical protein